VLLATGFFLFFWQQSTVNSQFEIDNDSGLCLRVSLAVDPLGFRLLRSLGTTQRYSRTLTAVVPSYLVRQFGVPVVEFSQWGIANRYSTLVLVWSSRSMTSWSTTRRSSSVSCFVSCMELRPIDSTGSNHFVSYYLFFLLLHSIVSNSLLRDRRD